MTADAVRERADVGESWDWQTSAACLGMDANLFFHPQNERGRDSRRRDSQAKRVCFACPVRGECLNLALSMGERYGIWGGMSPEEREALFVHRR